MKNNKVTAEEQDTDKHCSERKACRLKWLETLSIIRQTRMCRHMVTYVIKAQMRWDRDINDFVTTTEVQVTANTFQCYATVKQF